MLTAGLGTRLQPLTSWRAKPALPVAGATLIERILEGLASQGVRDLVLNLHHLPETITMVLGDGTAHGVRIRYSSSSRCSDRGEDLGVPSTSSRTIGCGW